MKNNLILTAPALRAGLLATIALSTASFAAPKATSRPAAPQTKLVAAQAHVVIANPTPDFYVRDLTPTVTPPRQLVPINRPAPSQRASTLRPSSNSLGAIRNANQLSRQAPAPAGFINSAMFYDYSPAAIYEVHTSPRFISTIALRPGERLISKAAGDTVRWVLGQTKQGEGALSQTLVFVKPIRGDLRTNIVLTTDQRTYMIEAVSHSGDAYTSIVSWNYPADQLAEQTYAASLEAAQAEQTIADVSVDKINFDYSIRSVGKAKAKPLWIPERAFDDGLKTYIQFGANLGTTEAPPLFVIGEGNQAELVNYRVQGRYYVIDRLITVAELRLGEKKQQIVRITRNGRR